MMKEEERTPRIINCITCEKIEGAIGSPATGGWPMDRKNVHKAVPPKAPANRTEWGPTNGLDPELREFLWEKGHRTYKRLNKAKLPQLEMEVGI